MDEYINRTKLLKVINSNVAQADNERCAQLLEAILDAPTEELVPKIVGKWKSTSIPSYFGGIIHECSICGAKDGDHSSILGNYCWRCGAQMLKD